MSDVIILAPHPDDEILGCFGAIKEHIKNNDNVVIVYMTFGEKGDINISSEDMKVIRKKEVQRVLTYLGINSKYFLSLPDGKVEPNEDSIRKLLQIIKTVDPKIIYSPNLDEAHRDHQNTSKILNTYIKKNPLNEIILRYYEIWTPLKKFNLIIDISKAIDEKRNLIDYYSSQLQKIRYHDAIISLNRYRGIMTGVGEYCEVYDCYVVKNGSLKRIEGGSGYEFLY